MASKSFNILNDTAEEVAPLLLGCYLVRDFGGHKVKVRIVEVEAYDQRDAASHSYRGETPRTSVMFGSPGHLYVYFTYGMHYCCNIVVGSKGYGSAVLIRAVESIAKDDSVLSKNRGGAHGTNLTNGPAKLCQALKINKELNGHNLSEPPLELVINKSLSKQEIVQTTRVGISREKDKLLRFYIKDNPFVSKK